jgi:hypothetical protein
LAAAIVRTHSAAAVAVLPILLLTSSIVGVRSLRRVALAFGIMGVAGFSAYLLADHFEPLSRIRSVPYSGIDATLSWNNRVRYWSGATPAIGLGQTRERSDRWCGSTVSPDELEVTINIDSRELKTLGNCKPRVACAIAREHLYLRRKS